MSAPRYTPAAPPALALAPTSSTASLRTSLIVCVTACVAAVIWLSLTEQSDHVSRAVLGVLAGLTVGRFTRYRRAVRQAL